MNQWGKNRPESGPGFGPRVLIGLCDPHPGRQSDNSDTSRRALGNYADPDGAQPHGFDRSQSKGTRVRWRSRAGRGGQPDGIEVGVAGEKAVIEVSSRVAFPCRIGLRRLICHELEIATVAVRPRTAILLTRDLLSVELAGVFGSAGTRTSY